MYNWIVDFRVNNENVADINAFIEYLFQMNF